MKVTFPYMGTIGVYKKVFEMLGHEVIIPPRPSQRTIDLGVKHSPEFICFPFKVIIGSYIEAVELGADTIITSGGNGPCRAGYYGELHRRILKSIGYDADVIVFDSMFRDFKDFYRKIIKIKASTSIASALNILKINYHMICKMDELEKRTKILRAYEKNPGEVSRVWKQIKESFDKSYTEVEIKRVAKECFEMLESVSQRFFTDQDRIRIGIVGEIYVTMEPSINMDVEERLGNMGIEVENSQYISNWVQHNARPKWAGKSYAQKLMDKGAAFIAKGLGGHEQENIGCMVDYAERGFDGIIHLMPFGCLPELVTQSTIPLISKKYDIPILTLSIDEQTGRSNSLTRMEAFVDLVKNRKKRKQYSNTQLMSDSKTT